MLFNILLSVFLLSRFIFVTGETNELVVTTDSGTYYGTINSTTPNVRRFLSIPFAVPPTGDLRWLPPQKPNTGCDHKVNATQFPPSCPQYVSKLPVIYNQDIPEWLIFNEDQSDTAGTSALGTSEDCLYLALWAPTGGKTGLPVIMFMTGGGFNTGGINVPIQMPHHWVQRSQSHIIVTINYRLNVFGFPNAAGLETQNVGLLDQRMALEWVRDNVAAFGGDPDRITLWGQSAGAISADYQSFAFPSNPIAQGFFMQSGSAFWDVTSRDPTYSNFTFVAKALGCDNDTAVDEIDCMRQVPFEAIEDFYCKYIDSLAEPQLLFHPFPDEKIVFSNYTARYARPDSYANKPAVYSNTANEGIAFAWYPTDPSTMGPNQTLADLFTEQWLHCPAALSSILRTQAHPETPVYRYEFAGNFSNVSPRFWMGPYHAADHALLFGTHQDLPGPDGKGSTEFEFRTSDAMEDYILAFAENPEAPQVTGSSAVGSGEWPKVTDGKILRFGSSDSHAAVQIVDIDEVDSACQSLR